MKLQHKMSGGALALLVILLTACGGGSTQPKERPLSQDEAAQLAQTMYLNFEKTGASFEVNTVIAPGQGSLRLTGIIDWKNHVGHANVVASQQNATLTEVVWVKSAVAERRPAFDVQLASLGAQAPIFLLRKPNMQKRLDQVISVVMGLATEQPENSQLILQKAGSAFLREDVLAGKPVVVLRYGERNIFWIEKETGLLLRLEGSNSAGTQPIVVDLRSHGEQKVGFPAQKYLVNAEADPNLLAITNAF